MVKLFSKWEKGMAKTRQGILGRISTVFKGGGRVDETKLEDLEQILIEGDVGVDTTLAIIDDLRESLSSEPDNAEERIRSLLKEEMLRFVQKEEDASRLDFHQKPYVILVVGVNGTGKTTTIGKLAHRFKTEGKKVLLAGADTFRAAAGEQLEIWAKRAHVDIVKQATGSDPAAVAFDALDASIARGVDVLIVDTAGRLHTKVNLMEELKKIQRVLKKRLDSAPHKVLLVLDATTGQNGLSQAKLFTEAVGIDGIVLTKLDGTARGGIVVAIRQKLDIPVDWVGLGEGIDDLVPFDGEAFVEGMLG